MAIWVLTREFDPLIIGGLGVVASNLTKAIANHGLKVIVVSKTNSPKVQVHDTHQSLTVIRFPQNSIYVNKNGTLIPSKICNWFQSKGYPLPNLIHIHSVPFSAVAKYINSKYQVPVVYTCHSLILQEKKTRYWFSMKKTQEQLLKTSNLIIAPSNWQRKKIEQYYPFTKKKVRVIYNGVNHSSNPGQRSIKKLLYVGRLVESKGIKELLKAIQFLSKRNSQVTLSIVGKGSKKFQETLWRLAKDLGISSRVYWRGFINPRDMSKIYHSHGAVVMPSKRESFGLVALEAMAHGVPLVASCFGGLSTFVNHRVAMVVPQVNSVAITKAIRAMWNNKSLTQSRIKKAKEQAQMYSWKNVALKYIINFRAVKHMGGGTS